VELYVKILKANKKKNESDLKDLMKNVLAFSLLAVKDFLEKLLNSEP